VAVPSPAALEDAARSLRVQAARVPVLLDAVAALLVADVWRGPAADEFALEVIRWLNALAGTAADLIRAAGALDARAAALRDAMEGPCRP
jgi:hypothetical protein